MSKEFKDLKIFKDSNLKEEVVDKKLDLGTVEAGDRKEYIYYLYNSGPNEATRIEYSFLYATEALKKYRELEIVSAPDKLNSKEKGKLVIKYSPSVTLESGMAAKLDIKAKVLMKPPVF